MDVIRAEGLRKAYGSTVALDGVDLAIGAGRIVGLVGANGAGKSTLLGAIVGFNRCDGTLRVLDRDPWSERDRLMQDVTFVSDVAVLPRWMRVERLVDYVAGVHPRFDRAKAERSLAKTSIDPKRRVRALSKGMVAQLHLALVTAIDASLLVLDEPTLGLDILYRKQFYDALLNDYFDERRTIVIATHQVDEVEHILSDVVLIDRGRVLVQSGMDALGSRFVEASVGPDALDAARALGPLSERQVFGRGILLFDGVDRTALARYGEVRTPSVADLFVGLVGRASARETA